MSIKAVSTSIFKGLIPFIVIFSISGLCHAAGMSNQGTSLGRSIMNWLYSLLGIAAVIYLIYLIIRAKTGHGGWNDIIYGMAYVVFAGAVLLIGDYLFVYGGSGAN